MAQEPGQEPQGDGRGLFEAFGPSRLSGLGEEEGTRLILDAVDELEAEGYTDSYIESVVKALRL